MQDVPVLLILRVDVRTPGDEELKNVPMVLPRSRHESSSTLLVSRLRRCSAVKQELHHPYMVALDRPEKRRKTVTLNVWLRALTQQVLCGPDTPLITAPHEPDPKEVVAELAIFTSHFEDVLQRFRIVVPSRSQQLGLQAIIVVACDT